MPAGSGTGTMCQRRPSHCSTSARDSPLLVRVVPAAHTSVGETAATAERELERPGALGLGTTRQCRPSPCATRVRVTPGRAVLTVPTAQRLWAEAAAMAKKVPPGGTDVVGVGGQPVSVVTGCPLVVHPRTRGWAAGGRTGA